MHRFLSILVNICRFSASPKDLPAAFSVLAKTIVITLVLFIVRNSYLIGSDKALIISVTQILLIGFGLIILLILFNKTERWLQSATALYGCSALVQVIILPALLMSSPEDISSHSQVLHFPKVVIVIASIWYFAIIVSILKETLEIKTVLAIVIAIVMELSFTVILLNVFSGSLR